MVNVRENKNSPDHVGTALVHTREKSNQSSILFSKHTYLKFSGTVANWKWLNLDLEAFTLTLFRVHHVQLHILFGEMGDIFVLQF